jgi:beta-N-acetylhexosaminidase
MESARPQSSKEQERVESGEEDTQKRYIVQSPSQTGTLERKTTKPIDTDTEMPARESSEAASSSHAAWTEAIENVETVKVLAIDHDGATSQDSKGSEAIETPKTPAIPEMETITNIPSTPLKTPLRTVMTRGKAILLIALLLILVLNAVNAGYAQFIGPQGWAFVIGGPASSGSNDLLNSIKNQLKHNRGLTPGSTAGPTAQLTPQHYINLIEQNMTLDQKLGQMMIVQFFGPTYALDISTMISQYHVGAVLLYTVNNNITDKAQLKGLIQQMQSSSSLPMVVTIDQEGGTVDRLKALDGPRPAAANIGATNDPSKAMAEGIQDAQDLASYGFNLNLAPVVDITNVYNPQLYGRTYGNNAALVTRMAQAYLQGLQQSGKVLGTLKHFPGLGDVGVDPHSGVPNLYRSKSDLDAIDWAPYRALIQQGDVHAIMVTHEIVHAIDDNRISSLSPKVVTGILRDELGFQGVIMTDSLTMEGITAYYTEGQAAAIAVEAGSDLLMGARNPAEVATMIEGIKQAIASGAISQQRIDDSVRRILMLKSQLGLLPLPKI